MSYVTGVKHEATGSDNVIIHTEPTSTIVLQDVTSFEPKRKRKHYKQTFRKQWQRDPNFATWLRPIPKDRRKAMCIACKSCFVAEITVIKNHSKGKRHHKNLQQFQQKVMISTSDSVLVEEENEESYFEDDQHEYVMMPNESDSDDGDNRSYSSRRKFKTERGGPSNWSSSPRGNVGNGIYSSNHHHQEAAPQIITTQMIPDDECDIFGKLVAVELRHLDDVYTKQNTKMKISTILYEARLSLLNRPSHQRETQESLQPYIVLDQSNSTTVSTQPMQ